MTQCCSFSWLSNVPLHVRTAFVHIRTTHAHGQPVTGCSCPVVVPASLLCSFTRWGLHHPGPVQTLLLLNWHSSSKSLQPCLNPRGSFTPHREFCFTPSVRKLFPQGQIVNILDLQPHGLHSAIPLCHCSVPAAIIILNKWVRLCSNETIYKNRWQA